MPRTTMVAKLLLLFSLAVFGSARRLHLSTWEFTDSEDGSWPSAVPAMTEADAASLVGVWKWKVRPTMLETSCEAALATIHPLLLSSSKEFTLLAAVSSSINSQRLAVRCSVRPSRRCPLT